MPMIERTCNECNTVFETWPSRPGRACSNRCAGLLGIRTRNLNARIEAGRRVSEPFQMDGQMACTVVLTGGAEVWIDAECAELARSRRWHLTPNGYAASSARGPDGKSTVALMHRIILPTEPPWLVDHINGNKLDNRRANLRAVTKSQNRQNYHSQLPSFTGVRGVYLLTRPAKFFAKVAAGGKVIPLGYFETLEEAQTAAEAGRRKHHTHSPEAAG